MGWFVMVVSLITALVIGDLQQQQRVDLQENRQESGQLWASQMLALANAINDVRYITGQENGTIPVSQLPLSFTPAPRIQYQLLQGRLWVWMPEQEGLVVALRKRSRGSALIGVMRNNQLTWLSGVTPSLTPPAGITEGSVIYLN
ncbi:pilus assembly protein PilP [Salmonella enterica subsp. enterica serovar Weybridge]|nr:pilus assembly protein PilP [Salmonella enterica subsp. enterica serovar Weybridge]